MILTTFFIASEAAMHFHNNCDRWWGKRFIVQYLYIDYRARFN